MKHIERLFAIFIYYLPKMPDTVWQIIFCKDKNNIAAEYALGGINNQLFASRYTLYIPNKDILIEQVRKALGE